MRTASFGVIGGCLFIILMLQSGATAEPPPASQLTPARVMQLVDESVAHRAKGNHTAAAEGLEQLLAAYPDHGAWQFELGSVYTSLNELDRAVPLLIDAFEAGYGEEDFLAYIIAQVQAIRGHDDAALNWLERTVDARFADLGQIRTNQYFERIREADRFRQLVGETPEADLSRVEGWRLDLDVLARELARLHAGLGRPSQSEAFQQELRDLAHRVGDLDDQAMLWAIRRLVASLGDGHTSFYAPSSERFPVLELPITLYFFGDDLHIIDAADDALIGSRVVAIGSRPTTSALEDITPYISRDNAQGVRWLGPYYLTFPSLLRELGYTEDNDRATLQLLTPDGAEISRTFEGEAKRRWKKLLPPRIAGSNPVPLYLQHPEATFHAEALPSSHAIYVQFNRIRDTDDETLAQFATRIGSMLEASAAQNVIIDLRRDNGGNSGLLNPMLKRLIAFEMSDSSHEVYVITGRTTFSAAQSCITRLERYTSAVFVGEPSSSSPNFVGEETEVMLPYSRTPLSISTIYWQDSIPLDRRRWIEPDVPVQLTVADYLANHDPVLHAVEEIIRTRRSTP